MDPQVPIFSPNLELVPADYLSGHQQSHFLAQLTRTILVYMPSQFLEYYVVKFYNSIVSIAILYKNRSKLHLIE